jgi:DNA-binding Lrp family transcriptional regulator
VEREYNMKEAERKMLAELVKNARRSDRELAKSIGTSQPTATRLRTKLEREGYIKEYCAIPDVTKIGYSILALTFLKLDLKLSQTELREFKNTHFEALSKNPFAVFLIKTGMGLGYDAVVLSLHENYASCDQFRGVCRDSMSTNITNMDTFLINLVEEKTSLPFTFSLFANQILKMPDKIE